MGHQLMNFVHCENVRVGTKEFCRTMHGFRVYSQWELQET
jgi:hypothetical protein